MAISEYQKKLNELRDVLGDLKLMRQRCDRDHVFPGLPPVTLEYKEGKVIIGRVIPEQMTP